MVEDRDPRFERAQDFQSDPVNIAAPGRKMPIGEKSMPLLHDLRSHRLSMIGEDVIESPDDRCVYTNEA